MYLHVFTEVIFLSKKFYTFYIVHSFPSKLNKIYQIKLHTFIVFIKKTISVIKESELHTDSFCRVIGERYKKKRNINRLLLQNGKFILRKLHLLAKTKRLAFFYLVCLYWKLSRRVSTMSFKLSYLCFPLHFFNSERTSSPLPTLTSDSYFFVP